MANPKVTFASSPIIEHEQEGNEPYEEEPTSSNGCNCFQLFSFKYWQANETESRSLLYQRGGELRKEAWVVEKFKEAKEFSELVAGPKWKTFIRKLSGHAKNKKNQRQVQYDSQSYALNFDGGLDMDDQEGLFRNASSRFPPTPPLDAFRSLR